MFKNMCFFGILDKNDRLQIELLRFCFIHLIHKDLVRMAIEWNTHRIGKRKSSHGPFGIPDVMFFTPETCNARSYHAEINIDDLTEMETELELDEGEPDMYDKNIVEVVKAVRPNWKRPKTIEEAQDLFIAVMEEVESIESA